MYMKFLGKNWHQDIYLYALYISYILYGLILLGLSASAPEYVKSLNAFLQIYVCLFLIYRFNPYAKISFTEFDRKIVFGAGIFLLTGIA